MTTAIWPTGVPSALDFGGRVKPQPNKVSFQPAVGPALERRRATLALKHYDVAVKMDEPSAALFLTFFENTLQDGTLPFTGLKDPFGTARTFRIVGEPDVAEQTRGLWKVSLKLEELPV
ncbi:hypothetical protein [Kordiimonas marina]|uniref:hypothetical protein n=1 Tax=Kordiimonas marina TaxID=2872312 RepID=UPI001FF22432|nr:hypothetical protein [Kordiimonas marina]MCJ9428697.1 hypothetical protein [Kordiimonas marina]